MNQNLTLDSIRIDGGTQARVALNQDTVAEYADIVRDGADLPPVVVFFDGTTYWLADGFHRLFGYKAADRAALPCDIRAGTQRDAILFACGANSAHGLRRTNADKRKAVTMLLADPESAKLSNRDVAKHCGVTHTLVNDVRNPAPAPKPQPKTGGGTPTGGAATPPKVEAPSSPKVEAPSTQTPPEPTEAEKQSAIAHGDDDTLELLQSTQRELQEAQDLLAAAEADDLKAEAIKWRRMYEIAQRRQQEMQATVNEREATLTRQMNWLRRIAKAVGEDDPSKVAAVVEAMARRVKAAA